MRRLFSVLVLVGFAGCQLDADEPGEGLATGTQSIVGGDSLTAAWGSVCGMFIERPPDENGTARKAIWCSCSLIAPNIVLTAASCVDNNRRAGTIADINLQFGFANFDEDGEPTVAGLEIAEVVVHRNFSKLSPSLDIALIRLASPVEGVAVAKIYQGLLSEEDAPAEAPNCEPTEGNGDSSVAGCVTLLGYGEVSDGAKSFGTLNKVVTPLRAANSLYITAGTMQKTTCSGDQGGPVFMMIDDEMVQVAVTTDQASCQQAVQRIQVSRFLADFI